MSVVRDDKELKERLIRTMKKEVKHIMEEAVTKKFVHEESSSITSLCAAIEACLSDGLKRRSLGLFKTSSTTALIHKLGKTFPPAGVVSKIVTEMEAQDPYRKSVSSGDSYNRMPRPPLTKKNSASVVGLPAANSVPKYLWIRVALFEKNLAAIIDHLIENNSKYYEREALSADPEYGAILSSLLVGVCALDYSRMKGIDHLWTDPNADELVQRQLITSHPSTPPPPRRPGLHYRRPGGGSSVSLSEDSGGVFSFGSSVSNGGNLAPTQNGGTPLHQYSVGDRRQLYSSAREYVDSLHQNNRATLLCGKNNVLVQPKDHQEAMPGYLSLHFTPPESLVIKWTPNHLMNGCPGSENIQQSQDKSVLIRSPRSTPRSPRTPCTPRSPNCQHPYSSYWEYALNVPVEEIVYLHCHHLRNSGGTIVLVSQDGTQYPHIHFPKGGHLLDFLTCLESGLAPFGHLDPPLWSQRGRGKVFPKLRRKARAIMNLNNRRILTSDSEEKWSDHTDGELSDADDEFTDYVFRIITNDNSERMNHTEIISTLFRTTSSSSSGGWFPRIPRLSSHSSSTSSSKSLSLGESLSEIFPPLTPSPLPQTAPVFESPSTAGTPPRSPAVNGVHSEGENDSTIKLKEPKKNKKIGKNSDSLELVCSTMKQQIISRAFYGWLAHCRHLRTVRTHLAGLVLPLSESLHLDNEDWNNGVSEAYWDELMMGGKIEENRVRELWMRVYLGGIEPSARKKIWPYLLGHYQFTQDEPTRKEIDKKVRAHYETKMSEWLAVEAIIKNQKVKEKNNNARNLSISSANSEKSSTKINGPTRKPLSRDRTLSNEVFEPDTISFDSGDSGEVSKILNNHSSSSPRKQRNKLATKDSNSTLTPPCETNGVSTRSSSLEHRESQESNDEISRSSLSRKMNSKDSSVDEMFTSACVISPDCTAEDLRDVASLATTQDDTQSFMSSGKRTEPLTTNKLSLDSGHHSDTTNEFETCTVSAVSDDHPSAECDESAFNDDVTLAESLRSDSKTGQLAPEDMISCESRSSCMSPSSSQCGGVYSAEFLELVAKNLDYIDKDVLRCDRNHSYFHNEGLDKLRNVVCTYVCEHIEIGYFQGMCDLVAIFLVLFDDEALCYSLLCKLLLRMIPDMGLHWQMDQNFLNMRSLFQILDNEMFELLQNKDDYNQLYVCYRWFLLDFKRELVYDDVYSAWETIWSATQVSSPHFSMFIALALVEHYRDIILDNNMGYMDLLKFFNEMAERHDAKVIFKSARNLVNQLQTLIEN